MWDQYLNIEGAAHIDAAIAAGRGGILVGFHSSTRYATQHYFAHLDVPLHAVGRSQYGKIAQRLQLLNDGKDDRRKWWTPARAAVATEAYRSLMRGELVGIAGDELAVANGVPAVIGDRVYRLSPGFAELAAATGAAVLPFCSAMLPDGRIQITIAPPLVGDGGRSRGEQVIALVQAYARVQTAIWRDIPATVSKAIIVQHLASPRV